MTGNSRPAARWSQLPLVRLVLLGLALAVTTVLATGVARWLVPPAPSPLHDWILLKNALLPVALLAVYALTVRLVERRPAAEVAVRPALALFPAGLLLGVAAISCHVLVLVIAGSAHFSSGGGAADPLALGNEWLVPWLTAVGEELLFRALLFRIAEEMLGTTAAVVISAVLFSLAHAANPGATPAALLALATGLGCLLALSFAATRSLWFPIGLHMGWNLAEGFLYGLPDSGQLDPLRLASIVVQGDPVLTGGDFGPEASAVLVAVCLVLSALLLVIARRRGRWVPARPRLRNTHAGA